METNITTMDADADKDTVLIKIIIINDVPYVWDAAEWLVLRRDHRICGSFDGGVHQSVKPFKGYSRPALPVRLSKVEAQYLVKHGIAFAFQLPILSTNVPNITLGQVEEMKELRRFEQLEIHRNKRKLQIESMVDKIIEGKRKKGRGIVPDRNTVIQEEMQKVELPYEMTQIDLIDPWIKDSDFIPCDYPVPNTLHDILKFRVFEDFHLRRKYFVSSGLKFGGDFLAYPDDPAVTHSQYIIVCHNQSRMSKALYVPAQVRLACMVKKILLVATLDEKTDKIIYNVMNSLPSIKIK